MHPGPQVSSGADVTIRKPPRSSEKSCCAAASGKNRNVKRHLQSDPCDESRCLLAFRWCSLPAKAERFGKPPPPRSDEITQIRATVLELARTARGRAVFVLDNGQTWQQIDGDDTDVREPLPGKTMKVTIAAALLNSYSLTIEG